MKYQLKLKQSDAVDLEPLSRRLRSYDVLLNNAVEKSDCLFDAKAKNLALAAMFDWSKTPEGHAFWSLLDLFCTVERMIEPIAVKLSARRVALVFEDGSVKVGCETFTAEVIENLIAAVNKQKVANIVLSSMN